MCICCIRKWKVQCAVEWSRILPHFFLQILPPSVSEDTTSALDSLPWTWFVHTFRAQMHFMPAMSLMATLSIVSCRCWMQMSARCLRDGKRMTNDANCSPIAGAFPCAQVHHNTVDNLHCTSYTYSVCIIYMFSMILIFTPQNVGCECMSVPGCCTFLHLWRGTVPVLSINKSKMYMSDKMKSND